MQIQQKEQAELNDIQNITQMKRQNFQNEIRRSFKQKILAENRKIQIDQNQNQQSNNNVIDTQDLLELEKCFSADQMFKSLNNFLHDAMKQQQEKRILGLLNHCNKIIDQDNNYIQNIFYQSIFDTLQQLLHQEQKEICYMTIRLLTNIFAQDFKHVLYSKVQQNIYNIIIKFLQTNDLDQINVTMQCLCNIFYDNSNLITHFVQDENDQLNYIFDLVEKDKNLFFSKIKKCNFLKFIQLCYRDSRNQYSDKIQRIYPIVNESMQQIMENNNLSQTLLSGDSDDIQMNQVLICLYQLIVDFQSKADVEQLYNMSQNITFMEYLFICIDIKTHSSNMLCYQSTHILVSLCTLNDRVIMQMVERGVLELLYRAMNIPHGKIKVNCIRVLQNIACSDDNIIHETLHFHPVQQQLAHFTYQNDFTIKKEILSYYYNFLLKCNIDQLIDLVLMKQFLPFLYIMFDFQQTQSNMMTLELMQNLLDRAKQNPQAYKNIIQQLENNKLTEIVMHLQYMQNNKIYILATKIYVDHFKGNVQFDQDDDDEF